MKPKCPHCHKVLKTVEETCDTTLNTTYYVGENGKVDNSKSQEEKGDCFNFEFECGECGEALDDDFVGELLW